MDVNKLQYMVDEFKTRRDMVLKLLGVCSDGLGKPGRVILGQAIALLGAGGEVRVQLLKQLLA